MDTLEEMIEHRWADVGGGVRLHYVEAGTGPLVVLLHGFPEFWYSWRRQIPVLVKAGYRVIAPDMRGYNLSDKPEGVSSYQIDRLTADIAGLIKASGADRATIVGHDWGAVVAWFFAMGYGALVERLVVLNVPHPSHYGTMMLDPAQVARSWYIAFFQLPILPERSVARNNYRMIRAAFRRDMKRDVLPDEELQAYVDAAVRSKDMHYPIHYYRALVRGGPAQTRRRLQVIDRPTMVIWGEKDHYLGVDFATPERAWVPDLRMERVADGSHFVQLDRPERVNALLLDFLAPLLPAPTPRRSGSSSKSRRAQP